MDRVVLLRLGYSALGVSFLAFAASVLVGALAFVGIAAALLGGLFLALSGDDLPRWSGFALLLYFLVSLVVFLAATPITVRLEFFRGFLNDDPSPLASALLYYLLMALPLMMAAAGSAAVWEREWAPRLLLAGALAGFILVGILEIVLVPEEAGQSGQAVAQAQGNLTRALFALSAAAGALGAGWATSRPDEYA